MLVISVKSVGIEALGGAIERLIREMQGGAAVKEMQELDHAAKVREARDARRKRILARSSERLAYITGEAKPATPLSSPLCSSAAPAPPLHPNPNFASRSLSFHSPKQASSQNAESLKHALEDSTTIKSCLGDSDKKGELCEDQQSKALSSSESNHSSKAGLAIAQPSKDDDAVEEAQLPSSFQEEFTVNHSPFLKKLSCSIQDSLLPRVICAACTALVFVGMFTLTSWGHYRPGSLLSFYSPLAIVLAMDALVLLGAFLFAPKTEPEGKPTSEPNKSKAATTSRSVATILMQLVLAVSLDCSIFASLLGGGLLLYKYNRL